MFGLFKIRAIQETFILEAAILFKAFGLVAVKNIIIKIIIKSHYRNDYKKFFWTYNFFFFLSENIIMEDFLEKHEKK